MLSGGNLGRGLAVVGGDFKGISAEIKGTDVGFSYFLKDIGGISVEIEQMTRNLRKFLETSKL